jgi:methylglutaconyl-CoA hydratase
LAVSNESEGTEFSLDLHLINAMRSCSKLIVGRIHGKAVGGVGIASACDYAMATKNASIKLSELAIGIGPFVIEPVVTKKIGRTAMAEMTLAAHEWKSADWAAAKGLYANTFETIEELDKAITDFSTKLSSYNPEALLEMKKVLWEGTQHWDTFVTTRRYFGKLVLSDFTKNALAQFKSNF